MGCSLHEDGNTCSVGKKGKGSSHHLEAGVQRLGCKYFLQPVIGDIIFRPGMNVALPTMWSRVRFQRCTTYDMSRLGNGGERGSSSLEGRGGVEVLSAVCEVADILEATICKIDPKQPSGTPAIWSPFTCSLNHRPSVTLSPHAAGN